MTSKWIQRLQSKVYATPKLDWSQKRDPTHKFYTKMSKNINPETGLLRFHIKIPQMLPNILHYLLTTLNRHLPPRLCIWLTSADWGMKPLPNPILLTFIAPDFIISTSCLLMECLTQQVSPFDQFRFIGTLKRLTLELDECLCLCYLVNKYYFFFHN